jgi:hypothetical protein
VSAIIWFQSSSAFSISSISLNSSVALCPTVILVPNATFKHKLHMNMSTHNVNSEHQDCVCDISSNWLIIYIALTANRVHIALLVHYL